MVTYYADVVNAILAMDSYNKDYNSGIDFEKSGLRTDAIEEFDIVRTSNQVFGDADNIAGFSATAYMYTGMVIDAGIVISYRGTDQLINNPFNGDDFGGDIWNGYGSGAGSPNTNMAAMAIKFYQDVASRYAGLPITLTGHSLGGGLAGLVAGIYHTHPMLKGALVFDNMAFGSVAHQAHFNATNTHYERNLLGQLVLVPPDTELYKLLYGNGPAIPPMDFSQPHPSKFDYLRTFYTNGEFLAINRIFQDTPKTPYDLGSDVSQLDVGPIDRHSIGVLAMLTYADARIYSKDWQLAGKYFWPILYDHDFAQAVGMDGAKFQGDLQDRAKYADILRMALAYSALEYGYRPYGDSAIDTFFYDAIELGEVSKLADLSLNFSLYAESISKIFFQYAASLLVGQVIANEYPEVLYGTLQDLTAGIHIDVSKLTWETGNRTRSEIFGLEELMDKVFEDNGNATNLKASMTTLWGTSSTDIIDFVSIAMKSSGVNWSNDISADTIYR